MLKRLLKKNSKGATAIEYALIVSLIAIIAITGLKTVGQKIGNQLNDIANAVDNPSAFELNNS